ncbi:hypothetical protein VNO77_00318 [Canavalia gladiata]|uniref:Uncharacterized protein n=1 Tax=Canavalia gladiata TaxID=3824 RepID=A0AAN9MQX0_CANGL
MYASPQWQKTNGRSGATASQIYPFKAYSASRKFLCRANILTKIGAERQMSLSRLDTPPLELRFCLLNDYLGGSIRSPIQHVGLDGPNKYFSFR